MEVYTTEPGVQVYTANWHNGLKALTVPLSLPEALSALKPNISLILRIKVISPSCVLKPEEVYQQITIYKFGVEK